MLKTLDKKNSAYNSGKKMRNMIISQVQEKTLKPGDRLNSTGELAKHYNISPSMVHRVLSELVDVGLLQRINGKGTFVRKLQKINDDNKIIGIPVHSQHNPFHVMMISEISSQINNAEIKSLLGSAGNEEALIKRMVSKNINSMLRFPQKLSNESKIWNLLTNNQINTVVINDKWLDGGPFSCVKTDISAGVTELVEHLISLGHEKIAFLDESSKLPDFEAQTSYFKAMVKAKLNYSSSFIKYFIVDEVRRNDSDIVAELLEECTATVIMSDFYAVKIVKIMKSLGVNIGVDFSIASIDGIDEAKEYGLTTARQNIEKIVTTSLDLLRNPPEKPEKIKIKPICIYRGSTGKLNTKNS